MKKYLKIKEKELKLTTLGFTLIELLGVIIVIGLVAVITVPVVKDIIKDTKEKGLEQQKHTIITSTKNWAVKNSDLLSEIPILVKVDTLKKSGFLENKRIINPVNKREMNGCVKVKYNVSFNQYEYEYDEECDNINKFLTSENTCIKEGTCPNGTKVNVKVNNTENYDFYVIKDENNELTLIMDRNLGGAITWITKEDYDLEGGNDWNATYGANDKGPITALRGLKKETSSWTNIPSYTYELVDDKFASVNDNESYKTLRNRDEVTDVRARLLTYTEAILFGCEYNIEGKCAKFLYENLSADGTEGEPRGYWLSTSAPRLHNGVEILYNGNMYDTHMNQVGRGIRPVINISKTLNVY